MTGRPPKQSEPRKVSLNIRLTETEATRIEKCAEAMGASRTDAIIEGISLLEKQLEK